MSNLLNEASSIVDFESGNGVDLKGAWAEVIASTVRVSRYMAIALFPDRGSGGTGGSQVFFDIGLGSAGNEVVEICNLGQMQSSATLSILGEYHNLYSMPWFFAQGVRISVRAADENGVSRPYHIKIRLFEQPK